MFDAEKDRKLEELFLLAADLPTEEREGFYVRHCGDDTELRDDLAELLRQDAEGTKDFLVSPVLDTRPPSSDGAAVPPIEDLPTPGSSFMPERIGRYLILERIGEGGMGSVYLAEQEHPVRRQVALKIVKPGMDTARVIQRFDMERQALALMNHPSIARIFDGGATEEGRPYFAMEYAPGLPITRFCDSEKLTILQRLELFCDVCEAVQHAHQKGIIHRDIKPSNVLVSRQHGKIIPKIIDFGIARATTETAQDRLEKTNAREVVGTAYYMSPEQARPDGTDPDTRSDIYSLGVLLYELLTGVLPFETSSLREKSPDEVRAILSDLEPLPPSARVARLTESNEPSTREAAARLARRRQLELPALSELLARDLDWVTLRAMEKAPARRYATALGLAADVRRFLNHEPVHAGPPDLTYRVGKFIRRNRVSVLSGSVVLLALIAGSILATWGMFAAARQRDAALEAQQVAEAAEAEAGQARAEAERARNEAEKQRDDALASKLAAERAESEADRQRREAELQREAADEARAAEASQRELVEREAEQLQSITDFLVDTVSLADSRASFDPAPTLESMLVRAGERATDAFRDFPQGEATALKVIGEALHSLGRLEDAERNLQRAVDLQLANDDVGMEELYETTARLAEVYGESDSRDAYEVAWRASELAAQVVSQYHGHRFGRELLVLIDRASRANLTVVNQQLETVTRLATEHLDADDPHWLHIAEVFQFAGRYLGYHWNVPDAIPLLEEALAIRRAQLPVTHPKIAVSINQLVTVLNQQDRHAEAEELAEESLFIYENVLAPDHWLLAETKSLLGECKSGQGYFIAAEDLLLPAHEAILANLGVVSRAGIDSTFRLVGHYESTNRPVQANRYRDTLAQALAFSRNATWSWGKLAAAFPPELDELKAAVEELDALARDSARQPNRDDALQIRLTQSLRKVIALREELLSDDDPRAIILARLLSEYSQSRVARGYTTDQLVASEVLRVLRPYETTLTRPVVFSLELLADAALHSENDSARAEEYAGQAWELRKARLGRFDIKTVNTLFRVCNALVAQGRFRDAHHLLAIEWEDCMTAHGPRHESTRALLRKLLRVDATWGRPTFAETFLEKHLRLPVDDELDPARLDNLAYDAVRRPDWSRQLYEHALRHARRANELAPESRTFATTIGQALVRLRRFEEAKEALEHALTLGDEPFIDTWAFLVIACAELDDEPSLDHAIRGMNAAIEAAEHIHYDAERFIDEAEDAVARHDP